jgi:cytochrome c peroxidase
LSESYLQCTTRSSRARYRRTSVITVILLTGGVLFAPSSYADDDTDWIRGAIHALQRAKHDRDAEDTRQATPPAIPAQRYDRDPSGVISTLQPDGPTITFANAFFQDIGSNGRTCFSCHQPQNCWGISASSVRKTFEESQGRAPIFRPVDGAVCPTADVSSFAAKLDAYKLLLEKGLIRIGLPIPAAAEFSIGPIDDPYGCNTNPATGLTSPSSGIVSTYRRPLPSTNLGFVNTIMWDGREPSLESQAVDATTGHAPAPTPPTSTQVAQIVAFETGLLTAQSRDQAAGRLDDDGAIGGPAGLQATLAAFFPGINDPLGGNPQGIPFTNIVFTLYDAWMAPTGHGPDAARAAVARGQAVFNDKPIAITGVNGINDVLGVASLSGTCGTCHDSPNVGNHSLKLPINIGIANAGPFDAASGTGAVQALDIDGLPVFTVFCNAGPHAGTTYAVTDLGRAMISGKCADIGKLKGPALRGLAGRAPYFHNGAAATLDDVVSFYDQRFGIGFTAQETKDLVAFLRTL